MKKEKRGKGEKSGEEYYVSNIGNGADIFFKFLCLVMTTLEGNLCSLYSLAFRITEAYYRVNFCEKHREKQVVNRNICH